MKFHLHESDSSDDAVLNVASMVDVVFILLSFFVLTATFGNEHELAAGMDRLRDASASEANDLPQKIVVRLQPGQAGFGVDVHLGRVSLGRDAYTAITEKLAELNLPETPVVLACDGRVPIDQVSRAIDAILASPMRKISLSPIADEP